VRLRSTIVLVIAALTAACIIGGAKAETGAAYAYSETFQSPSGNIRCGYVSQVGVGCYTRNNARWAFLESFGEASVFKASGGLPGGRVLGYGRTWRRSTFRCHSSRAGMDCWSVYTGNGFFINRSTAYAY
jgi:hypothetical protein